MTNTTTAPVSPIAPTVPSQKFIDYLIKKAVEESASPEEVYRELIESTWARATSTKKHVSTAELVTNYTQKNTGLVNRIAETHTVMFNTLQKMTRGVPKELAWAQKRYVAISITGIFRKGTSFGSKPENITSKIANGTTTFSERDIVRLTVSGQAEPVDMPAYLLNNDPMAIAHYVRNLCKIHSENLAKEAAIAETVKQVNLKRQKENATKELEAILADQEARKIKQRKKNEGKARAKEFHTRAIV